MVKVRFWSELNRWRLQNLSALSFHYVYHIEGVLLERNYRMYKNLNLKFFPLVKVRFWSKLN
jgi:hypothetical protein